MRIYQIDPINDERWARFLERHPKASVFHTVGWLQALRHSFQYEPVVFTTSSPTGELKNGLLFCRIESKLTGHRLVSLPFSDHCEPLCDSADDLNLLLGYLQTTMERQNLKYLEIRPVDGNFARISGTNGFRLAATYYLHVLNLRRDLDEVFRSLDRDSVQRRIQRAERAGLTESSGTSEDLLKEFYALFVMTRGRHHLPPIPYRWFLSLIKFHGQAVEIRVAYKDNIPISSILTLRCKDKVYYKYGCSDARFNKFGGMPWLLWRAITTAKSNGAGDFDMGRTEEENMGLLVFKNHWVPDPLRLAYWRFPDSPFLGATDGWKLNMAKYAFSLMPDKLRTIAGKLIYRHIG
ncbi:MAG TPA: GNAT family N-acetyltransferase [Candidatus Acidoferrum sp.]|nr:GNAT family N-acetyltransferase [Candidatus Acidoferrum sp.]